MSIRFTCPIAEGGRGACGVRYNDRGSLYTLVYDKVVAREVNPIDVGGIEHGRQLAQWLLADEAIGDEGVLQYSLLAPTAFMPDAVLNAKPPSTGSA